MIEDHIDDLGAYPVSHWTPYILYELVEEIKKIRVILQPRLSATLKLKWHHKGDHMAVTVPVGTTGTSLWQEWSGPAGTGSVLPTAGPVTYTSSDPTIVTVDPATGNWSSVAPGTATITGVDNTNSLTASDMVSDTAIAAQSATLTVSANVAAPK